MPAEVRPQLQAGISGKEFLRWYWLRSELVVFAREIGVRTSGGKEDLTIRIAAALDGHPDPTTETHRYSNGVQLGADLTLDTVIPNGQGSSQALRSFFLAHIGPSFRFDGEMRAFIRDNAGRTLRDAVAHWYASRSTTTTKIGPQFEYNRFTRQWHIDHPLSTRADLLAAWQQYRSQPADARSPRVRGDEEGSR